MCRRFLPFFCAVLALLLQGASVNAREALLHQFFVGDTAVWVLSLGWKEDPTTILRPASEEDKAILVRDYPQGKVRNSQNVLLIRDKKHVILVDAGPAQSADELYASLLRAGTSPEAVTHVILTHAHADHTGGLVRGGKAAFPRASILFPKAEIDYWLNPANKASAPKGSEHLFTEIPKLLEMYGKRVFSFTPGSELFADLPGVQAVKAPGHTPGHVGVTVSSGGKTFLFWGDLLHAYDVQTALPDMASAYDMNPTEAARSRKALLERARAGGWLACGAHVPFVQPREL